MTIVNRGTIEGNILMGEGDDVFDARGGTFNSIVAGGHGDDVYRTSSSGINIEEGLNAGEDKVVSTVSFKLGDNLDNLALLGKDDISGKGNALENDLVGNKGDNRISGRDGSDTLLGGSGRDVLNGGAGDDTFVFRQNSDIDVIKDFSEGDLLVIDFIESYELDDLFANHIEKKGDGLVITYGDDRLFIHNTKLNELSEDDFAFV